MVLSVVLASIVGYERELHSRPAGLRTHILVAVGSTLFTIVSVNISPYSPDRIAAQVVSGIGFLGAGTIIRQGNSVLGLTTAASLWASAAIGLAVGGGGTMMGVAVAGTAVVYATLTILRRAETWVDRRRTLHEMRVTVTSPQDMMQKISAILSDLNVEIAKVNLTEGAGSNARAFVFRLAKHGIDEPLITERLSNLPEVITVEWA